MGTETGRFLTGLTKYLPCKGFFARLQSFP